MQNPLNKMINSSRFVKTLVDNINTCLYDTQKHQGASSVLAEKAVTQPAGKGQPQCNASNHMPHEDSSLEEFDFLNKVRRKDDLEFSDDNNQSKFCFQNKVRGTDGEGWSREFRDYMLRAV